MSIHPRRPKSVRLASALVPIALLTLVVACAPAVPAANPPPAAAAPTTKPAAQAAPAQQPTTSSAAPAAPAPTSAPAPKTVTLPKPEQTSVKIGHTTVEPIHVPMILAKELGIYKKYGLDDVELYYHEGDGKAVQALIAGSVDISTGGAGMALASQTTDVPITSLLLFGTTLSDALISASDVKTAADLKGKSVAISTFGSTAHGSVLLALKGLGLSDDDVTITQVGGQSSRLAAVKAGSVAAAPVDVALEDDLKAQGFNILIRVPDTTAQYARTGLQAKSEWIKSHPNTVLALVASVLEAQQALFTQTDKAVDTYMRWAQLTDRAAAEKALREHLKFADRDMQGSKEAWEVTLQVVASQNPALKDIDVTKAYDYSYLEKLNQMGFNDAIGVPPQ